MRCRMRCCHYPGAAMSRRSPDSMRRPPRRGTPKAQTNDELRRLRARSPLRIAEPVFHGTDTGLLFLDEE